MGYIIFASVLIPLENKKKNGVHERVHTHINTILISFSSLKIAKRNLLFFGPCRLNRLLTKMMIFGSLVSISIISHIFIGHVFGHSKLFKLNYWQPIQPVENSSGCAIYSIWTFDVKRKEQICVARLCHISFDTKNTSSCNCRTICLNFFIWSVKVNAKNLANEKVGRGQQFLYALFEHFRNFATSRC